MQTDDLEQAIRENARRRNEHLTADQPRTEFRDAYLAWIEARDRYNSRPGAADDATAEELFNQLSAIEAQIAGMSLRTVQDYAYKILVADDRGDMATNIHQIALVEEARKIAGVSE